MIRHVVRLLFLPLHRFPGHLAEPGAALGGADRLDLGDVAQEADGGLGVLEGREVLEEDARVADVVVALAVLIATPKKHIVLLQVPQRAHTASRLLFAEGHMDLCELVLVFAADYLFEAEARDGLQQEAQRTLYVLKF